MKGTRPLLIEEIKRVSESFTGAYAVRNRALFLLGISSGARISELLSLCIRDVWQNSRAVTDLHFTRDIVKGKETARRVPLNKDGTQAIENMVKWHRQRFKRLSMNRPLFPSRNSGKGVVSMTRRNAHDILKSAFERAGLNGNLATHSMRKSYAQRLYHETHDIYAVKEMLGHKSVATTQAYLGTDYDAVRRASEAMSLHSYEEGES